MVREGQGPSGCTKHGGWQWNEEKGGTEIINSFRAEFGISPGGDGDPRWYPSNSRVKRLGDCWNWRLLEGSTSNTPRVYMRLSSREGPGGASLQIHEHVTDRMECRATPHEVER
jgi:hypothetical protein